MKKIFMVFLSIMFFINLSNFLYAVHYDNEYAGKVSDTDTGEPLVGAVAVGVWYKVASAAGTHNFFDAEETVTNENGEFKISKRDIGSLKPMRIIIFKMGYEYKEGIWDKDNDFLKKARWANGNPIIPLKKLTIDERKKRALLRSFGSLAGMPVDKIKILAQEVNREFFFVPNKKDSLSPAYYEGKYTGKVIDTATGKPLSGAVVLGIWYTMTITPGGGTHNFYDAEETITDKNGEFKMFGKSANILSKLEVMRFIIFKAEYEYIEDSWEAGDRKPLYERYKMQGNKPVISIKKLTMEERKKRLVNKESIPDEKQKLLIRELNKERIAIGLTPYKEINKER